MLDTLRIWEIVEICEKSGKHYLIKSSNEYITYLGFSYCNLNGHLAKIGVKESGLCRFCEKENEDPEYILLEREAITRKRAECPDNLQLSNGDIPSLNPLKILNLFKEIGLEEVL